MDRQTNTDPPVWQPGPGDQHWDSEWCVEEVSPLEGVWEGVFMKQVAPGSSVYIMGWAPAERGSQLFPHRQRLLLRAIVPAHRWEALPGPKELA